MIFDWFTTAPRRMLALMCAVSIALLVYGLYLQHVVNLDPCPMCIVQRYALVAVAVFTGLASAMSRAGTRGVWSFLALLGAMFGGFTAARQSWLQWYPPEFATCGRDFYGMIENYSISRAIPMIFRGSGDCTAIDWTFLGLSIANWSFLSFLGFSVMLMLVLLTGGRRARVSAI